VSRTLRVFIADRSNVLIAALQAPVIGLFTWMAFAGFAADDRSADSFVRSVYYFHELKSGYIARGETMPLDAVGREARKRGEAETRLISEAAAQRRASIYFSLVSAAIWFGVMGACREVVQEIAVVHREARSGVRLGPYLLAKVVLQVLVVGAQTGLLTLMMVKLLLGLDAGAALKLWGVLALTGITAACLGLLISSLSPTQRVALTFVPILMMPQILMGGLLRPPARGEPSFARDAITSLTLQRWGFEAATAVDRYARDGVLSVQFGDAPKPTPQWRYTELDMLRASEGSLVALYFKPRVDGHLRTPALVLGAFSLLMLAAAGTGLRARVRGFSFRHLFAPARSRPRPAG
jgi:ABC transport system ATP-binding/permease protein